MRGLRGCAGGRRQDAALLLLSQQRQRPAQHVEVVNLVTFVHALVQHARLCHEGLGRAGAPHAPYQEPNIVQQAHLHVARVAMHMIRVTARL